jgi:hypothetical protein
MANVDAAIGFVPIKKLGGGHLSTGQYTIADQYNTALGKGDPVQMTGTGRNIAKAEAANQNNRGIFLGCHYTDAQGNFVWSEYWPAATATKDALGATATVMDDPLAIMRVQTDTLAAADVQGLADWDAGTPSAVTRLSGVELVASVLGTTGKAIRIVGLSDIPDNAYGAHAKADVMWAAHDLLATGAGV